MEEQMKIETKKSLSIKGIVSLILLIIGVVLYILVSSEIFMSDYKIVTVTVQNVESHFGKFKFLDKVEVSYQDKEYKLINIYNTYMYREGSHVEAFYANEKMYANEAGIRTDHLIYDSYMVVLLLFVISLVVFLTARSNYKKQQKQNDKFPTFKF
jgi:cytochrome c biogenesis factor